ncbi:MAG: hypothetical protein ABEJ93_02015 [Candidatus Nanohalobium sp.]
MKYAGLLGLGANAYRLAAYDRDNIGNIAGTVSGDLDSDSDPWDAAVSILNGVEQEAQTDPDFGSHLGELMLSVSAYLGGSHLDNDRELGDYTAMLPERYLS